VSNDVIGIGCVFALTFLLFVLRHLYLSIGRREKSRQVTPAPPPANERSNSDLGTDNAWLLWTPDLETEVRINDRQRQRAPEEKRSSDAISQHR
jgi:hypothetical protein